MDAVDAGYRVVLADDALCSVSASRTVARRHAAAFQLALPADRSSVVRRNPGQLAYAGNLNLLIETLARNARYALYLCAALRLRVAAAFFADADRALAGRFAAAAPPSLPPLRDEA